MSGFNELDRILGVENIGALDRKRPVVEDRFAAEEYMRSLYTRMSLPHPRFTWALSPKVLHGAIEMLRTIHVGQRHNMIEALVPYDENRIRRDTQKTLLEAIISPDITVSMGAPLARQLDIGRYGYPTDLAKALEGCLRPQNLQKNTPAGWGDACIYGPSFIAKVMRDQTLCVLPYVKVCWMCAPPVSLVQDEGGTLWKFADGWEIYAPKPKPPKKEEPLTLDGDSQPRMQARNVKQLTEGKE